MDWSCDSYHCEFFHEGVTSRYEPSEEISRASGVPMIGFWALEFMLSRSSHNHPKDEDLSLGTPVTR